MEKNESTTIKEAIDKALNLSEEAQKFSKDAIIEKLNKIGQDGIQSACKELNLDSDNIFHVRIAKMYLVTAGMLACTIKAGEQSDPFLIMSPAFRPSIKAILDAMFYSIQELFGTPSHPK